MANSKFGYVKEFEQVEVALPMTFMVVRVDGRGFTKFCESMQMEKPNDLRGI